MIWVDHLHISYILNFIKIIHLKSIWLLIWAFDLVSDQSTNSSTSSVVNQNDSA